MYNTFAEKRYYHKQGNNPLVIKNTYDFGGAKMDNGKQLRIKDINFGKIDANNELMEMGFEKYLDSFFDYDKYSIKDFIQGNRYYICGDKGTGKTALLKYLEVVFKKNAENLVIPIRFKTDIDELDKKGLRSGGIKSGIEEAGNTVDLANVKSVNSYIGIWQVFLIHKILEEEKNGEYEIFKNCKELKTLTKLMEALYASTTKVLYPK